MTKKPRLLLHICCAPDATIGIEASAPDYRAEGFFYNPNILPGGEYHRRRNAMDTLGKASGFAWREEAPDQGAWEEAVRGLEDEPEKGIRCSRCIRIRLRRAAETAKREGFAALGTVLTASPRKDARMVNNIGRQEAKRAGVEWWEADLKKEGGFQRSIELSKRLGIYRQDFCGCRFSRKTANR